MTSLTGTYCQAASERSSSLQQLKTEVDFCKAASAFDTMIDYVRYCPEPDSRDVAARAAVEWVIPYFRDTADKTWFDDFGWWTIATARAAGLLSGHLLTDQQTKLKNII